MKFLLLIGLIFSISACNATNESYYMLHPKELQQKVTQCSANKKVDTACEKLQILANEMEVLAMDLSYSPQGFGKKILALQQKISQRESFLKKNKGQPDLKAQLVREKHELKLRLATVRWLESPGS